MERFKPLLKALLFCGFVMFISGPLSVYLAGAFGSGGTNPVVAHVIFRFLHFAFLLAWIPVAVWIYNDAEKHLFFSFGWAALVIMFHNISVLFLYLLIDFLSSKRET